MQSAVVSNRGAVPRALSSCFFYLIGRYLSRHGGVSFRFISFDLLRGWGGRWTDRTAGQGGSRGPEASAVQDYRRPGRRGVGGGAGKQDEPLPSE